MTDVNLTATADRQLRALRGKARKAALRVVVEIENQGCRAAGNRLTGDQLDHICCRHLYRNDRMLIMWPAKDRAVVVSIAPHDRGVSDVYDMVIEALGLAPSEEERTKPPCCDTADGRPPVDEELVDVVAGALREVARRR